MSPIELKDFISSYYIPLKNIKVAYLIVFLLLIGVSFQTHAADRFEFPEKEFSIALPTEWKVIPRNIIFQKVNEMQKRFPTESIIRYDIGFQKIQSENWFEYPYVLVSFKEDGKIRQSELDVLKASNSTQPNFIQKYSSDVKHEEWWYEPDEKILWMRDGLQLTAGDAIRSITAIIPTEFGVVNIFCFSKEEEFDKYYIVFRKMIRSIELGDKLKYNTNDSVSNVFLLIALGILGLLFLIIGLRVRNRLNRKI